MKKLILALTTSFIATSAFAGGSGFDCTDSKGHVVLTKNGTEDHQAFYAEGWTQPELGETLPEFLAEKGPRIIATQIGHAHVIFVRKGKTRCGADTYVTQYKVRIQLSSETGTEIKTVNLTCEYSFEGGDCDSPIGG